MKTIRFTDKKTEKEFVSLWRSYQMALADRDKKLVREISDRIRNLGKDNIKK